MHGRWRNGWILNLVLAASLWAAGPDEDYVRIYRTMVEADAMRDSGDAEAATRAYKSAKEGLETIQTKYPAWNERLVVYRLNYINAQIKFLSGPPPVNPAPGAPPAGAAPATASRPDPQIEKLREENLALRQTAARLEAKLKEALSVQPNSTDPKELARAQDQLKSLAKENEALRVSLQEEQKKLKSVIVTNTVVMTVTNRVVVEPPDIVELRRSLTNQLVASSALKVENDVLKKELAVARANPPAPLPSPANPELEKQLQEALRTLKSVQEANQQLAQKQSAIEKALEDARASEASQQEKLKRLEGVEKELVKTRSERESLADAKLSLEKRLSQNVETKNVDSETSRRLLKLEKELIESQSEVRMLTRQKADLEAKLTNRGPAIGAGPLAPSSNGNNSGGTVVQLTPGAGGEAVSVEVHRQLKQAAWEVLNLQAQNQELLRKQAALEQQLVRSGGSKSTTDAIDEDRMRRIEKLNQELSDTRKSSMKLEQENQDLVRQLAENKQLATNGGKPARSGDDSARKQLTDAQSKLKLAEDANRELQRKAEALIRQLAEAKSALNASNSTATAAVAASTAAKDSEVKRLQKVEKDLSDARDSAKRLEQENRNLEKKLTVAQQQTTSTPKKSSSASTKANNKNLERELAMLKSRLQVLEAKAVPYTEQELSLFSRLQANLAANTDSSSDRSGSTATAPTTAPTANATVSAQTVELIGKARADFDAGRFAEAELKLQDAIKQDDRNVNILAHLAAAQFEQGKLEEAEKSSRTALAVSPEDGPSLYMLGIISLRRDRVDEALDALGRSAKVNPENAVTQNSLGVALSQKGQREPAETAFRRALQLRPDYPDAHYNLSVEYILHQPPSFKLAQWHYQKAIANGHPRNPELERRLETAIAEGTKPSAAK